MKPIPGFTGYFASESGDIFSFRSRTRVPNRPIVDMSQKPLKLRPGFNNAGYKICCIMRDDGRMISRPVHSLVASAFFGERPKNSECSHLNGNRQDNRAANLGWETSKKNNWRKRQHGTYKVGFRHHLAAFSESEAINIKSLLDSRAISARRIARCLKVNFKTILKIRNGQYL